MTPNKILIHLGIVCFPLVYGEGISITGIFPQ